MQVVATHVQFECDLQPNDQEIWHAHVAMQNLCALAAVTLQSRQHFAITLGEQISKFKKGDTN